MDRQHRTHLVGHRRHLAQEGDQVPAQHLGRDALVAVQLLLELFQREALLRTRKSGDHVARDELDLRGVHLLVAGLCGGTLLGRILLLGARTFQDEEVEGHEGRAFETQRPRPVGKLIGEVRARPVQHRHEVVGDDVDAARRQVADRLLVILDIGLEVARAGLDVLVHRDALHDRPHEARIGDHLLPLADLLHGPHLAVGNMVQGVDDIGGSGLADVREAHGIVRPVPPPRLFAKIHNDSVFTD